MKLQKLHIKNFKSIVDLEIVEPNPFTVFVGPNGSGKSNIFEALEFINIGNRSSYWESAISLFGGEESFLNRNNKNTFSAEIDFQNFKVITEKLSFRSGDRKYNAYSSLFFDKDDLPHTNDTKEHLSKSVDVRYMDEISFEQFFYWYTHIFIGQKSRQKLNYTGDYLLSLSTDNLEKVLKRILQEETKKVEIKEWLDLFIPGFENIEIVSSELSSTDTLVMYEKGIKKPFTKDLLSDGTYNILALLTAVYQSDEPQFLCIEEPENGLHPQVIRELVSFFREACQNGHYIWLNTHSQTLVDCLTTDEIILVDKIKGETQVKQLKGRSLSNLPASELWLSGALGGGVTW
ncbi:MAG: AAA family ATPase [Spirosomataceae bacterium]